MNFEDEDYRRLYVRKTVTYHQLEWQGRAVMHEMLYEFDRAGAFDLSGAPPELAVRLVTGLPDEVVQAGLSRLLKEPEPTWVVEHGRLVWPTFAHAQNCRRSDRLRKQDSRGAPSPSVTGCHSKSQGVTPNLAKPNLTKPNGSTSSSGAEPDRKPTPVQRVFNHWRQRLDHPKAKLEGKRKRLIASRLKDFSVDELFKAINGCAQSDWHMGRDPKTAGKRYDGIELILRDAAHIERFIAIAEGKQSGRSTGSDYVPRGNASKQRNHGKTGWESLEES